jgi:hypothetical protein
MMLCIYLTTRTLVVVPTATRTLLNEESNESNESIKSFTSLLSPTNHIIKYLFDNNDSTVTSFSQMLPHIVASNLHSTQE